MFREINTLFSLQTNKKKNWETLKAYTSNHVTLLKNNTYQHEWAHGVLS
jgi:hypothetical protein